AGSAGANRGVVLEFETAPQDVRVFGNEPAEPKTGQAVGFAHGTQADGAFVDFASGRKTIRGVVLEFAVNLVTKKDDATAGRKAPHLLDDAGRHHQPGGIVRRVDVDDFRVGLDEFLESSEIMGPAILLRAGPLADSRSGTARESASGPARRRMAGPMISLLSRNSSSPTRKSSTSTRRTIPPGW